MIYHHERYFEALADANKVDEEETIAFYRRRAAEDNLLLEMSNTQPTRGKGGSALEKARRSLLDLLGREGNNPDGGFLLRPDLEQITEEEEKDNKEIKDVRKAARGVMTPREVELYAQEVVEAYNFLNRAYQYGIVS
jgi:hypothetical protein